jgi:hypothetical protein
MTDTLTGELDRLTAGNRIQRPPRARDKHRAGADHGEWDWWWDLPLADRRWISTSCMSSGGIRPDVVADAVGMTVDAWASAFCAAALARRPWSADPLDWEEPEPADLWRYDDTVARASLDLVGPVEVAARAGVGRTAVAHWRRRYPDFPAPLATIGTRAGRHGGSGTPVWNWPDVDKWLTSTGRGR